MIFPETMSKVQIITTTENINEVIRRILEFGNFQPEEVEESGFEKRFEEARRQLTSVEEQLRAVHSLMDISGVTISPKGKLKATDWIKTSEEIIGESKKVLEEYHDLLESVVKIRDELLALQEEMKDLEPFKNIDAKITEIEQSEIFQVDLAIVTPDQFRILQELKDIVMISKKLSEEKIATVIITIKGNTKYEEQKRQLRLKLVEIPPGYSPQDFYKELSGRASRLQSILSTERTELTKKVMENEGRIREIYGRLLTVKDALTLLSKAVISDFFVVLEGYAPYKKIGELKSKLDKFATLNYKLPKRFEEKDEPPTLINLPKPIKVFDSILNTYGTPSYWELSPTIFLTITFPVIFGLMFPDLGNALMLLAFAIWLYRYYGVKKGSVYSRRLAWVLIASSIVSAITGTLLGEFFGPLLVGGLRELTGNPKMPVGPLYYIWPVSPSIKEALDPLLPIINIGHAIKVTLLIASILLFGSTLLSLVNIIKKKDYTYAIYHSLPFTIVFFVPFAVMMYGFTDPLNYFTRVGQLLGALLYTIFNLAHPRLYNPTYGLAFSLFVIFIIGLIYAWIGTTYISYKYEHESLGNALMLGFVEGFFELILLSMSNTLSFLRILIFALAHYYLLFAFSYLGYVVAGYPATTIGVLTNGGAIALIIVGNLLAAGLEGLSVFVQTMRLHFYEMFSKFYEGAGREFMPAKSYVELL